MSIQRKHQQPYVEEYKDRMRASARFQYFGVEPAWRPGEGDVDGFITDEVVRQGHDPGVRTDGGQRIDWMRDAWDYARSVKIWTPSLVERVGTKVEPWKNARGFRAGGVRVGGHVAPDALLIAEFIEAWCEQVPKVEPMVGVSSVLRFTLYSEVTYPEQVAECETADDIYLAFEWLHPFLDGNGRTGKILHNSILGTLDDPVLVRDYFGGGIP